MEAGSKLCNHKDDNLVVGRGKILFLLSYYLIILFNLLNRQYEEMFSSIRRNRKPNLNSLSKLFLIKFTGTCKSPEYFSRLLFLHPGNFLRLFIHGLYLSWLINFKNRSSKFTKNYHFADIAISACNMSDYASDLSVASINTKISTQVSPNLLESSAHTVDAIAYSKGKTVTPDFEFVCAPVHAGASTRMEGRKRIQLLPSDLYSENRI